MNLPWIILGLVVLAAVAIFIAVVRAGDAREADARRRRIAAALGDERVFRVPRGSDINGDTGI